MIAPRSISALSDSLHPMTSWCPAVSVTRQRVAGVDGWGSRWVHALSRCPEMPIGARVGAPLTGCFGERKAAAIPGYGKPCVRPMVE
jgi:hypothetical protein